MSRPGQHLAHFNWATLRADPGQPEVAGFVDAVPRINALAQRSPGFVWRHGDEWTAANTIRWPMFVGNPRVIASFSLWEDVPSLSDFVYATVHGAFYRRADAWFEPGKGYNYALWWVPEGHIPSMSEARGKVDRLLEDGPSAHVFDFESQDSLG